MATQVFAEEELERLRGFPEIGRDELFPDDVVAAPPVAVARLADQLGVDPGVLRSMGGG